MLLNVIYLTIYCQVSAPYTFELLFLVRYAVIAAGVLCLSPEHIADPLPLRQVFKEFGAGGAICSCRSGETTKVELDVKVTGGDGNGSSAVAVGFQQQSETAALLPE